MRQTLAITRKELNRYFGSPMALIFIGVFLAATLFSFFWIDTFFARGIADVRPLFRWMPLLLIFLVAALTMRQWSEESQSGTLELLLTMPIPYWKLVLGKFLAVMALVALALALTISLPITVSTLGNLDWGPVLGGYLAAILMASSFAAIGLFISSRTDNDIVALILTVVIGALLHLLGTRGFTEFAGDTLGNLFRALSTGSRFESIERGVIDLRDLVYYLTLALLFLGLNIFSLDTKRWSQSRTTARYRTNASLAMLLLSVNLLALNIWLHPQTSIRLDLTEQNEYTLSDTTRELLGNLQEPLLIRAYFSERTHPLLAPLVPRITDTLREYEIAGGGNVVVEVVDPAQDPDLEAEANQTYGIQPTPFQIAGRYESALVNAYFDILIRYGDQSEVLNFRDLIEVEAFRDGQVDVRLRSLEYDLTRTINKTVFGFQSIDSILAALPEPATLTLYITPDFLPPDLQEARPAIESVAAEIEQVSGGNFSFQVVNPDDPASEVTRQTLFDTYGLQPFAADIFAESTYYLHMVLQVGDQIEVIYPSGDLSEASIRNSIEAGLKRFSSGFLKVVGLWRPVIGPDPTLAQFGQTQQPPFPTWDTLAESLRQEYDVRIMDLSAGRVPPDVDVLLIVAPQQMNDTERYAIDQYLMRGGAVVIAGSSFRVQADPFSGELTLQPIEEGLHEMLAYYGIEIEETLVMDPQNEPFPIAVTRNVGGFDVQEIQSIDYPYFVDVRADGMDQQSPIITSLPALTLNWVSPVNLSEEVGENHEATVLLRSSPASWLRSDLDIQPDTQTYPEFGFPMGEEQASEPLAVSVIGQFESFFADQPSPLQADQAGEQTDGTETGGPETDGPEGEPDAASSGATSGTIEQSPATARLVVIGSGDFLNDTVFNIRSQLGYDRYLDSLQFIQNTVDWAVEDLSLLDIRSSGSYARVLEPLDESEQSLWEIANYAFALLSLILIGGLWAAQRRSETPIQLTPRPVDQLEQEVSLEQA